ncbi:hypothetical protein SOVF_088610 [Spinacia oleracea]|nr:hypothetical protein SOVF_088610 [Spinacia oleracea]
MDSFKKAKVVRLRSQHQKYLTASEDEDSVKQSRNGSSKNARWTIEPIEGKPNVIRLKSCYSWKYLSASEEPFLLGWTGKRVFQSSPRLRLDSTVEWEPIKHGSGSLVKLMTRNGNFLRGNAGVPPWNNSVTHDVPSRNTTQDWILWNVDIIEVDYQSTDDVEDKNSVVEESIGCNVEDHIHGSFSSVTTMEEAKHSYQVGSPVSSSTPTSARSNSEVPTTPSPRASPTASEKSTQDWPQTKHSGSFNKLKSMLDGLQDLLDGTEEEDTKADDDDDDDDETSAEFSSHQPHQLDVRMAKQTLLGLKNMNFETMLSSGRDKRMYKSINVLIADAKLSSHGQDTLKDLINLKNQLKSMRNDRIFAYQELNDYKTFCTRKLEVKAQLKKDAAKAHELETLEDGFSNTLATAIAKRDILLKQIEEVDSRIKAAERTQADNAVEIEQLISRMGDNSQCLREMDRNEKSLQAKKVEAENTLESVEEQWLQLKGLLQDI